MQKTADTLPRKHSIDLSAVSNLAPIIGLVPGMVKGLLAAYVDVPFFIVTIVIGALPGALGLLVLGKETVLTITNMPTIADMTSINILTLGGFYLAGLVLFNDTRIGKSCKLIGGNQVAALQSGINIEKNKISAFLIAAQDGEDVTLQVGSGSFIFEYPFRAARI